MFLHYLREDADRLTARKARPAGEPAVLFGQHIIRRSGPVEPASRSGYARGDGQRSNRRHRSSRHCMRRDRIRHSSRRIRGRTLQTHVGEILHGGSHRSRNVHESRHRGSLLHLNQRRENQRCYGSHHRRRRPCRHRRRLRARHPPRPPPTPPPPPPPCPPPPPP